jgi:hypothetical protein
MSKLRLWLPVLVFIALAIVIIVQKTRNQSVFTNATFEGKIISREQRASNRAMTRDEAFVIRVKSSDGQVHEWFTNEMAARSYEVGDGVVKLAGKAAPAIFRDGRQVRMKGIDFYLDEEVNPPKP